MESPNAQNVLQSKDVRVEIYDGDNLLAALSELVTHWVYVPAYINDAGEQVDPVVHIEHMMTAAAAKDFAVLNNSEDLSVVVVMMDSDGSDVCKHVFTPSEATVQPGDLSLGRTHDVTSTLVLTVGSEVFFVPPDYEDLAEDLEEDDEDEDGDDDEDDDLDDEDGEADE